MIKTKTINKLAKLANKSRDYQPILTNLLIEDGSISTTDLDHKYSLIGLDKSITGLLKIEHDLIGNTVQINQDSLVFSGNEIKLNKDSLELDEYPKKDLDFSGNLLIQTDLNVIECALNFCCTYDLNNILNGVNFAFKHNVLHINATDGNILYSHASSLVQDHTDFNVTVPLTALKNFVSLIENKKEKVFLSVDKTGQYIGLSCGNITCELRCLDGTFPRVESFFNADIKNSLYTDLKRFNKANTDIVKLANEITYVVELQKEKLVADYGAININLQGNKDIDIYYSAKLMKRVLTGLSKFKCQDLKISLTGSLNPMYLKSGNDNGIALLMPIKHEKVDVLDTFIELRNSQK